MKHQADKKKVFKKVFRSPDISLELKGVCCTIIHQVSTCISLLQCMRTNVPGVFCGGDLATFPLAMAKNRLVNIGHWQMAQGHGNVLTNSRQTDRQTLTGSERSMANISNNL